VLNSRSAESRILDRVSADLSVPPAAPPCASESILTKQFN
jgi:hypothetical protein